MPGRKTGLSPEEPLFGLLCDPFCAAGDKQGVPKETERTGVEARKKAGARHVEGALRTVWGEGRPGAVFVQDCTGESNGAGAGEKRRGGHSSAQRLRNIVVFMVRLAYPSERVEDAALTNKKNMRMRKLKTSLFNMKIFLFLYEQTVA